ncbi:MAPEG family protein [Methylocella sp.]|uniref:MAPEG family protein n=1 Tax=Methylocella sp. TaxID=1978226 RepID=UPI00378427DF
MSLQSILAPVFVEIGLIFFLTFWMVAARHGKSPERAKLVSDCFSNHFEIPVLFFALVPLAILTRKADTLFVVMSWIFVLSRLAHAAIHTGPNTQPARGIAWLLGVATLFVMWVVFALRILFAGL